MLSKGINDTVFEFGTSCNVSKQGGGHYGYLVLKKDGTVYGYKHSNENTWKFDEAGNLNFISKDNEVTSQFKYFEDKNSYIGSIRDGKQLLYLLPVISFPENNNLKGVQKPSIFVNTVPKSGTYLLNSALKNAGYKSSDIMLIGRTIVSDLRNISEENYFKQPKKTTLKLPCELTIPLFNKNVITGHIEYMSILDEMRKNNMFVLTLVRDLRNVLLSLFKFKKDVFELQEEEKIWATFAGKELFEKFIEFYHDKDLEHIRNIVKMTLFDPKKIIIHYENCVRGFIPNDVTGKLNEWSPDLGNQLAKSFLNTVNKKTATLSPIRSDWKTGWNDVFEKYYHTSGLAQLNKLLGYD
jgi:hypothetical protein